MARLALIDDDPIEARLVRAIFRGEPDLEIEVFDRGLEGVRAVVADPPDCVLLDAYLPDVSGLDAMREIHAAIPSLPVLLLTGDAEVRSAIEAMRAGAFHYLAKPVAHEELRIVVQRAIEQRHLTQEVLALRRRLGHSSALGLLLGLSEPMRAVTARVQQVAPTPLSVLIQGETGTGKDLVARAIHEESGRTGPLIAVDCGALPESLAESELFGHERGAFTGADRKKEGHFHGAEGGTLFLDEVGNLPPSIQVKLLRVLQERTVQPLGASASRRVDVRIVAATNEDLARAVERGRFRQDLYYRLDELAIRLPPLRERPDDIAVLAARFREAASVELRKPITGFDREALDLLRAHAWPGNVRELRSVVRQCVLVAEGVTVRGADVRDLIGPGGPSSPAPVEVPIVPRLSLREIAERAANEAERQAIVHTLRSTGGNRTRAAELLRIDAKTLYAKIKRYGVGS